MQKLFFVIFIAIGVVFTACISDSGSVSWRDSLTIADENDERLPKATEVGSNTAGAYVVVDDGERRVWTMGYRFGSAKQGTPQISIVNDSLKLALSGDVWPPVEAMWLEFHVPNLPIDSLEGLQQLSGWSSQTSGNRVHSSITLWPDSRISTMIDGGVTVQETTLRFTQCRSIYHNGSYIGESVCGRFEIRGRGENGVSVMISDGRFDLLIRNRDSNGVFR